MDSEDILTPCIGLVSLTSIEKSRNVESQTHNSWFKLPSATFVLSHLKYQYVTRIRQRTWRKMSLSERALNVAQAMLQLLLRPAQLRVR